MVRLGRVEWRRRERPILLVVLLLTGCSAVPQITGVVAGAISGGATGNPAIGFGVGVATIAVADYTLKRVTRSWHQGEQDAIAAAAGDLQSGARAPWRIVHSLPLGNEHGELEVVRQIDNPLAPCKEVAFSVVDDGEPPAWYTAAICRHGEQWKWASAEPSVERWGFLQ